MNRFYVIEYPSSSQYLVIRADGSVSSRRVTEDRVTEWAPITRRQAAVRLHTAYRSVGNHVALNGRWLTV